MTTLTTTTLENIDRHDYPCILRKMEYSFGVTFNNRDLEDISSFGTLCDIVTDKLTTGSIEDRTTQQAFYKICSAIAATQPTDKTAIKPDSRLDSFFPLKGRKRKIKAFQKALGADIDLLVMNDSLEWAILISAAATFIALLFSWTGGITCLAFTIVIGLLAGKFGKEMRFTSVQQLADQIAREHYTKAKYHPATIDKNEISVMLEQLLVNDIAL